MKAYQVGHSHFQEFFFFNGPFLELINLTYYNQFNFSYH